MSSDEQLKTAMQETDKEATPGAASVKLNEDGILRVVIDLNVPGEMFIETRVGVYGSLKWAEELATRWIMAKEMKYVKDKAMEVDRQRKLSILTPPPGVIDVSQMRAPK